MSTFDPWTASYDEAIRESEAWKRQGKGSAREAPLFQFISAQQVTARRAAIESGYAGAGFDVLRCIEICGNHGLVIPEWLSYAFNLRYYAVTNARAGSWDSPLAFGRPYPKGTHLSSLRKARTMRFAVFNAVRAILNEEPDTPIDRALFERVGNSLGLGRTQTEKYYYQLKRIIQHSRKNSNFRGNTK